MDTRTLLTDLGELVDYPVIGELFTQYCIHNHVQKAQLLYDFCREECERALNDELVLHVIWSDALEILKWIIVLHPDYLRWFVREPEFIDALHAVSQEGLRVAEWWASHQVGQHDGER